MAIFRTGQFTWLARLSAAALIGMIAYLTLARVGLVYSIYYRLAPWLFYIEISKYVAIEHFVAFAFFGALCWLAYPKHISLVLVLVFGSAISLELLQSLTPDRHGTLLDAVEKVAGGACGVLVSRTIGTFWQQARVRSERVTDL
jgi:hypothetical protein